MNMEFNTGSVTEAIKEVTNRTLLPAQEVITRTVKEVTEECRTLQS